MTSIAYIISQQLYHQNLVPSDVDEMVKNSILFESYQDL